MADLTSLCRNGNPTGSAVVGGKAEQHASTPLSSCDSVAKEITKKCLQNKNAFDVNRNVYNNLDFFHVNKAQKMCFVKMTHSEL